jgi:NAD(P)-dependent dehydrogenase (short-subunit alcohol dehydrogenase family)
MGSNGVAVVTGATGMLGRATARALAARGADVVLVGRDLHKVAAALAELEREAPSGRHRLVVGDLSSQAEVRRVARAIDDGTGAVRALVHTAAALKSTRAETADGHEWMFATNVLARLQLTRELHGALKRGGPARVVLAAGPSPDRLDLDDLMARRKFQPFLQFRATNAANLMLTFQLGRALRDDGVSTYAFHPGILQSELMQGMPALVRWITFPFGRDARPAGEALAALAWGAGGEPPAETFFKLARPIAAPKASLDPQQQSGLWQEAHRLLGLRDA